MRLRSWRFVMKFMKHGLEIAFFLLALMPTKGFSLPEQMECRAATFSPESKFQKFEVSLKGGTKEVDYISPAQKEYKLRLTYNKTVSNLTISVAVPKFGNFEEIFHAIAPVVEINGQINEIHIHLFSGLLDGESLVVECPPAGN
jgi:hypothetical protein